jgi:hypothetical protein
MHNRVLNINSPWGCGVGGSFFQINQLSICIKTKNTKSKVSKGCVTLWPCHSH